MIWIYQDNPPKVAVVEATTRSQDKTISVPPASAGPSTAAMMGLVRSRSTMPAKPPRAVANPAALPALISLRSAPAQNAGPAPVITMQRAAGSAMAMFSRTDPSYYDHLARFGEWDTSNDAAPEDLT